MALWLKRIALILVAALVVAQFIPLKKTNPAVDPSKTIYASLQVPPQVGSVFERSCKDCHSNQTVWPWYSHVAPVSWMIVHDVNEGRSDLNLSEWGTYTAQRKDQKFKEICDDLANGEMPDRLYALAHRQARLTEEERTAVCQWAEAARKTSAPTPARPLVRRPPCPGPRPRLPLKRLEPYHVYGAIRCAVRKNEA